jgi:acyl transferase domain-containing protein
MSVLKRLADPVAENDNILGIICGVEVNQIGLAHSITHLHASTHLIYAGIGECQC